MTDRAIPARNGHHPDGEGRRIQVRESVRAALREEGLSLSLLSEQTGASAGALRAFLRDAHTDDAAALVDTLDAWLRTAEKRERLAPPKAFVHTSHTRRIYAALRLLHEQGGIGAIYGDPGTGKTMAFLAYRNECPAAILLTASPAVRSPRPVMLRLLGALRRGTTGGLSALVSAAEYHLARSNRLLIVDEAQHLTNEAIDLLRCLVDATGVRLVFGGNNTLWDRFHAKGGIPFEQLTSRVTVRLHLDATRMTREDVEVVVRQALGGASREHMDWFLERAPHAVGHYRFIANHCRLAKQLAQGQAVTAEHLEAAGRMMG